MFKTRFTETLGIKYPIMQGAIAYLSGPELVAGVSNAGGLGTLAIQDAASVDEVRNEIRKVKSLTDKPFAVNISMLPGRKLVSDEQVAEVVASEHVAAVETVSMGKIPDGVLNPLKQGGVKIIHKCTKVRHGQAAEQQGVDVISLLGYGADGHPGLNEISHLVQVPKAVQTLKIPVICAGAIADARGFVAALALGADGVLMGTRFLTAKECPIHPKVREWMLEKEEGDIILVGLASGDPSRAIKNKLALEVLEMEKRGAPVEETIPLRSGQRANKAFREGDIDGAVFHCGQVIGLIDEILTAKEIIDRMIGEARTIVTRLGTLANK